MKNGNISKEDVLLFKILDDPQEVVNLYKKQSCLVNVGIKNLTEE